MSNRPGLKGLIAYYGVLQSLHLLVLLRAGALILSGQPHPFPILPSPQGWQQQAMAFMYGLAGMDIIGILLGIRFAYLAIFGHNVQRIIGILSLTIFISGAVVFATGTFPTGAWSTHPAAYWGMVVLFLPALLLYGLLLLPQK